jgi:cytochrome c556
MKSKLAAITIPLAISLLAASCAATHTNKHRVAEAIQQNSMLSSSTTVGEVQLVAALDVNPGNVAVSKKGRIFTTVHQLRSAPYRLIEINPEKGTYSAFPDLSWNRAGEFDANNLYAPLGLRFDANDLLWVIDNGSVEPLEQQPKLIAFNINSGKPVFRYDFTPAIGPKGSMIQDFAIDEQSGFIYLADIGRKHKPALIVLNTKTLEAHRYENLKEFLPENVDIVIDGKKYERRIGIDPITISADKQTLYFGSMTGTSWYAIPTSVLRAGASVAEVSSSIRKVGVKPVSDGAATDAYGNHYFTDLNNNAITVMRPDGTLQIVAQNPALSWPDNIAFGNDGWLYVAANQLHKTPFFNSGVEGGVPPYRILRVKPIITQ